MKTLTIVALVFLAITVGLIYSPERYDSPDGDYSLICGIGFFYNDDVVTTLEDVADMEDAATKICPVEDFEDRKAIDIIENAILIEGEICTINWQLTPEAHIEAFNHHCNKKHDYK